MFSIRKYTLDKQKNNDQSDLKKNNLQIISEIKNELPIISYKNNEINKDDTLNLLKTPIKY